MRNRSDHLASGGMRIYRRSIHILLRRAGIVALVVLTRCAQAAPEAITNQPPFQQPISLLDAVNTALRQSPPLLEARQDLEAEYGIAVQMRAVALPKVQASGSYEEKDPNSLDRTIEQYIPIHQSVRLWSANIRLVQSVYQGGRLTAAWRTARLTRERSLLDYQTVVRRVLLDVQIAYADVLATADQIRVQTESVQLQEKQLSDTRNKFNQGLEPQFSVLRSEVELANSLPRLVRARNANRQAKQQLLRVLGYEFPQPASEDLPLLLSDALKAEPVQIDLAGAVDRALHSRPELTAMGKRTAIREAAAKSAVAPYKPAVQLFGGYGVNNSEYDRDLLHEFHGWNAGAQLSWDLFDSGLTRGKIQEARAELEKSRLQQADTRRQIEFEVRTAFSNFVEARELLLSHQKVIEQAQSSLRMAQARYQTGEATQLDLLSAQTALTEARSTHVQALRDYTVALAQLEHAMGK